MPQGEEAMIRDDDIDVLQRYSRPVFHMRRQVQRNRFGLVFGAGLSQPWGMPNWTTLNRRIADAPEVQGLDLLPSADEEEGTDIHESPASETVLTQRLYERFKANRYQEIPPKSHHTVEVDKQIRKGWRDLVHAKLYEEAPPDNVTNELNTLLKDIKNELRLE